MPNRRRRKKNRYDDARTEQGRDEQAQAAFAAIKRLYCDALPLWRTCTRSYCRRNHACGGDGPACLKRTWPLMPPKMQEDTFALVRRGGPRRIPAATRRELELRSFSPTNFVL